MKLVFSPLVLLMLCLGLRSFAAAQVNLPLMPLPQKVSMGSGRFLISNNFKVALQGRDDGRVKRGAERFQSALSRITGIPLPPSDREIKPNFTITWNESGEKVQKLGE